MNLLGKAEGTEIPLALLPSVLFFPTKFTGHGPGSQVSGYGCTDMAK